MKLQKLEQALHLTSRSGARQALLVLGNGVHLQAMAESNIVEIDPWIAAVRRVGSKSSIQDVNNLPVREPLLWDALVRQATASRGASSDQIDTRLRARLVKELISTEKQRNSLPLFGRILALRFENILSFNIDRTLALSANAKRFAPEEAWQQEVSESRFYMHDVVSDGSGVVTRIWYPYGNTSNSSEILLGTSSHATGLMTYEDKRSFMMHEWVEYRVAPFSYPGAKPHTKLMSPKKFYRKCQKAALQTWYRLFFTAPLVIVGASLPLEDWPMWWLLHQRARNLTIFPPRETPQTFYLTTQGQTPPHLFGRPAEIDVVEFPNYAALWKFVLQT